MKLIRLIDLDRAGQWCSGLCAVHCVITGFAVALLPALRIFAPGWLEWGFLAGSAVLGVASLWFLGARRHRRLEPLAMFSAGFALLIAARALLNGLPARESAVTICAGCLIVAAHRRNSRLCRCCHPRAKAALLPAA